MPTDTHPAIFSLWPICTSTAFEAIQYTPLKTCKPGQFPARHVFWPCRIQAFALRGHAAAALAAARRRPGSNGGGLQVGVQLIHQGCRGDVQADDVRVGDVVQVFHQRGSSCRGRRSPHAWPSGMVGAMVSFQNGNARVPPCPSGIRSAAPARGQAGRSGRSPRSQRGSLASRAGGGCRSCGARPAPARRRTVWPSPPCSNPAGAIVALVQAPAVLHRQPGAQSIFVQAMPQRARGAFQDAGVGQVEPALVLSRRPEFWPARCRWWSDPRFIQPVKRFSRFTWDSPWRIRTSLYMVSPGSQVKTRYFRMSGFFSP